MRNEFYDFYQMLTASTVLMLVVITALMGWDWWMHRHGQGMMGQGRSMTLDVVGCGAMGIAGAMLGILYIAMNSLKAAGPVQWNGDDGIGFPVAMTGAGLVLIYAAWAINQVRRECEERRKKKRTVTRQSGAIAAMRYGPTRWHGRGGRA